MKKVFIIFLLALLCSSCQTQKGSISQSAQIADYVAQHEDKKKINEDSTTQKEEVLREAATSKNEVELCSEKNECREEVVNLRDEYASLDCVDVNSEDRDFNCSEIRNKLDLLTIQYKKILEEEKEEKLFAEKEKAKAEEEKLKLEQEKILQEEKEEKLFAEQEKTKAEEEKLKLEQEKILQEEKEEKLFAEQEKAKAEEEKLKLEQEKILQEEKLIEEQKRIKDEENRLIKERNKVIEENNRLIMEINNLRNAHDELVCKEKVSDSQYARCVKIYEKLSLLADEYDQFLVEHPEEKDIRNDDSEEPEKIVQEKVEYQAEGDDTIYQEEFIFEHDNKNYVIKIDLSEKKYSTYSSFERRNKINYVVPIDYTEKHWKMFIFEGDDDEVIEQIISGIKKIDPEMTEEELLKAVITLVQYLPYDDEKFNAQEVDKLDTITQYPYETLVLKTGVCRDTTILLAKLFANLGYKVGLFHYEKANHITVGIGCDSKYDDYDSGYCFVETTGIDPIGYIPEKYADDVVLDANPEVFNISSGKDYANIKDDRLQLGRLISRYGKGYFNKELNLRKLFIEIEDYNRERRKWKCDKGVSGYRYAMCMQIYFKQIPLYEEYDKIKEEREKERINERKRLERLYNLLHVYEVEKILEINENDDANKAV